MKFLLLFAWLIISSVMGYGAYLNSPDQPGNGFLVGGFSFGMGIVAVVIWAALQPSAEEKENDRRRMELIRGIGR